MTGIRDSIVAYGTTRLRSTFHDHIGNEKAVYGTGFWLVFDPSKPVFVTNKHNIDPTLKLGLNTKYKLTKFEILLRRADSDSTWTDDTEFFTIWRPDTCIYTSLNSDCAIVAGFSWENRKVDYKSGFVTMKADEIADQSFFFSKTQMMDHIAFVGFPGEGCHFWWDTVRNLPISRSGNIASLPYKSFENVAVTTADTTLVSGLSFSGSSGSPVFLLQKGYPLVGGGDHDAFAPAKLLGIMSGHFWDTQAIPNMFRHSGLSYFTRSTAIIDLLKTHGYWPAS